MSEELTNEERKHLQYQMEHVICQCGHPRNMHNRYIAGMFIGCQIDLCTCTGFTWPEDDVEKFTKQDMEVEAESKYYESTPENDWSELGRLEYIDKYIPSNFVQRVSVNIGDDELVERKVEYVRILK